MTGSVHKKKLAAFAVLAAAIVGVVVAILYSLSTPAPTAEFNSKTVPLEIVRTSDARMRGLSGRHGLDGGMLFVFDEPGRHCMWMKDMKFSIDIVWLNQDQIVVHKHKNAGPESYPEAFCPDKPAKYVVELSAGSIERLEIEPGQRVELRGL